MLLGKNNNLKIFLAYFFAVSIVLAVIFPAYWFAYSLIPLFAFSYVIVHYRFQVIFLKILVFLLPFSFDIEIFSGAMLSIPTEPLIAILAFILMIEVFLSPKLFIEKVSKEVFWLLPMLLAFFLTTPFSQMVGVSLKFSIVNFAYITVFFIYLFWLFYLHPKLYIHLVILYCLGLFLVTIWGLFQYWQLEWNPIVVRGIFRPFYTDHTIFGATAALLGGFWLAHFFYRKGVLAKFIAILPFLFFASWVVLSTSRAAFLSIIFSFFILLILLLKVRIRYLAIATTLLIAFALFNYSKITLRMQSIKEVSYDSHANLADRTISSGNITTDVSNIERLNRWVSAIRMFKDKPLTGFGPGTYQFTYIPYQDESLKNRLTVTNPWDTPENSGGTAHSEYLLAMSEMGILGIMAWIILLSRWIYISFNLNVLPMYRKNIVAAFVALSTYMLHGLFNNFLNTDKVAFLFWATAAWLTVNYHLSNEQRVLQKS